jgi:hypothetical protein
MFCAGPVAQNVMEQHAKTSEELSNLAAARHPPTYTAATGQPLTHYHSFFSELLSWRNPSMSCASHLVDGKGKQQSGLLIHNRGLGHCLRERRDDHLPG